MQIFLIGFMGSGKSFTAKALSEILGKPYLDLDSYIEKKGGQSIATIFKFGGEHHFRQIEHKALNSVIKDFPNHIIATGGGTPMFHENLELMKNSGLTVYLEAKTDLIAKRLDGSHDKRPLLQNATGESLRKVVESLIEPRKATYSNCHIAVEIDTDDTPVAKIIAHYVQSIT